MNTLAVQVVVLSVALSFIPAIVAARMATNRGRSGIVGALLGLVVGWIGVVIVLLRGTADSDVRRSDTRAHRECPFCKEQMRCDASICPHCQKESSAWVYDAGEWRKPSSSENAVATSREKSKSPTALLEIRDLHVHFRTRDGVVHAVEGAQFSVERERTLGIVGESGSGKSVTAMTVIGLTRFPNATITGEIEFDGIELVNLPDNQMRSVRGRRIAMIFQDPLSSLHPLYKVGWQIVEAIQTHEDVSKSEARARAIDALHEVGIPSPEKRIDSYPHELSGGMRQRVMIAMALVLKPDVLIADEPTTALDVTVQAQILDLIRRLKDEYGTAIVMITHDLGVIAELADEVAVMYAGRVMEKAPREVLFTIPELPYTWGLMRSIPRLDAPRPGRLDSISGMPPSLIHLPPGCPFHPRCPYLMDICLTKEPELKESEPGHLVSCHLEVKERQRIGRELQTQYRTGTDAS
jgi:peptide/nickel transport system ATP-binding protein